MGGGGLAAISHKACADAMKGLVKGWPRVSIGLPVCNGDNYLVDAVHSVLAQTF